MKFIQLFEKELKDVDENDLFKMEADPVNFESFQIEYKISFDGDASELRRDVVQFANGLEEGYILYGISNDPIKIIGIEKTEVDRLKSILNDVLPKQIDPQLSPFPQFHPVPLTNGKYVLIIKIFPKGVGIYGIRQSDAMNNRNYFRYEFYERMDGSKHVMNVEEIVNLIEKKSKGQKKYLDVSIHGLVLIQGDDDMYICIEAVNKSVRPIIVNSYSIELPEKNEIMIFVSTIKQPKYLMINSQLPCKLEDGEDCKAFLSRKDLEKIMSEKGWNYPIKIRALFDTNDGKFVSDTLDLDEIK